MDSKKKVEYLIVDTSAFIKNAALQDIGDNILTEQAVVNEITSKRQLRRLVVLPYDLKIQEAFPENIKFVTEFSKKSGDYTSLSATDIKVIALTYQLEKQKVGTAHLKDAPTIRVIKSTEEKESESNPKLPVGFYTPKNEEQTESNANNHKATFSNNKKETNAQETIICRKIIENLAVNNTNDTEKQEKPVSYAFDISDVSAASSNESDYETAESDTEENKTNDLSKQFMKLTCNPTDLEVENENEDVMDNILAPVDAKFGNDENDVVSENKDDYDDSGWITPGNLENVKKQMDSEILEEKTATVACLTMDFAIQNILLQMGLNVVAMDGRVIKQMRTFIFRCYACFKTTSIMTKIFCPHCGHKTLKKVEVTLDENGKQQIHINFQRPLSARGKKVFITNAERW
ncbi:RNA-binding protein NOB1 isoform X2 [Pseudomyrmex gracilis]|uniref:RNA-binding protein NOB1 isoform X2 n=1 Tax=Pseudomyrmex gracilis TaxID=219809 RepID=UPI00099523D6|nr:RNA-binding protein NOB1 isoform X2 [Pseudomyrmex gracilis]